MTNVLIDCDTGIDDALALIYLAALHKRGEITLLGATTTAGNVGVAQTALNTRWILDQCGLKEVPVASGRANPLEVALVTTPETHGDYGLGYVTPPAITVPASNWKELWQDALGVDPNLTLIISGPASNLAEFGPVSNTTLMGGAYLYPGNTTPTAEWNTWVDPHAAQQVFAAATSPITVCSLGVTEQFTLDPESLDNVVAALGADPIAQFLPEMLRFYFEFHQQQGEGYLAQIHDLLTCMIALNTVEYQTREATVKVETESQLLRGTTVADQPESAGHWGKPANALIVEAADIAAAHQEFLRAITVF